jgi:hypothetical protein
MRCCRPGVLESRRGIFSWPITASCKRHSRLESRKVAISSARPVADFRREGSGRSPAGSWDAPIARLVKDSESCAVVSSTEWTYLPFTPCYTSLAQCKVNGEIVQGRLEAAGAAALIADAAAAGSCYCGPVSSSPRITVGKEAWVNPSIL